ncbi:MAG: hypothetical protein HKP53_00405 [Eudoraea sp.]|nr:hypothetical protein [Eudoraea sp.]
MTISVKHILIGFFFVLLTCFSNAQDRECRLGLGGSTAETIIQVFQLNEEQIQKMNEWTAELKLSNKVYQDEIAQLFDTHPQSKTEDLEALATKYKVLKDKVLANTREYDLRLLELFNPKQYDRYLELCATANRIPYKIIPKIYPSGNPE